MNEIRKYNLEGRLIDFAVRVLELVELLPNNRGGIHLANQLVRSGTAPALIYGEAQAAESKNDFIHKMKIALKELRESQINMKIIEKRKMLDHSKESAVLAECTQLVAILMQVLKQQKEII
ncbi:four helix bundle protein [Chitinophaga sp. GbtcB8]|uniref:four helix bundle protein n=1 Tax=Chitinophaga sp. GbtcB8 TaxID=2824753 RepID=UPI001C2F85F7|nr:four helix bundle protein [Chitinophaga sp. GbtcB8]